MVQPFYQRLEAYFARVGAVLRGERESTSVFPNTSDVGLTREHLYARVLQQHVPASCNVDLGGFLFGQQGDESKQLDVILTDSTSLRFAFYGDGVSGKVFSCIDGCVAVAAVKSMLSSSELGDALEGFAALPEKQPLKDRIPFGMNMPTFDDWPYKIVFAFDGVSGETLLETLAAFYLEHAEIPRWRRPNLIHIAGKYVAVRDDGTGPADYRTGGPIGYHVREDNTDVAGLVAAIQNVQTNIQSSQHILTYYHGMIDPLLDK
jgi:hypothetical protein